MSSLDAYRKRSTINVRALAELIDGGQELREFKESVWETLRKDPLFRTLQQDLTVDEQRIINFKRLKRLLEYNFETIAYPAKTRAYYDAINCYSVNLLALYSLHKQVCSRDSSVI